MATPTGEFVQLLRDSVAAGSFLKLTLGAYRGTDATLRNLHVRPVELKAGLRLSFVWRHATRDLTKNLSPPEALDLLVPLIGGDFHSAHLFAATFDAQLEITPDGTARLRQRAHERGAEADLSHDRKKSRLIAPESPWLHRLGVTTQSGAAREGMAAKFKQINRFVELLAPLVREAGLPEGRRLEVTDMGCGKGYLTFAFWQYLHETAAHPVRVRGIEQRPDLVSLCQQVARECRCDGLEFAAGTVADAVIEPPDILIALHACDTATDDAIARGVTAGAALIVVAPCCHKELSPQLVAPPVLAPALRNGIFHERQAEFATDALRCLLLEWAQYETRAFEFISTEHTPKNLMIAAVRRPSASDRAAAAARVREFAAFFGIRSQRLAAGLGFPLTP